MPTDPNVRGNQILEKVLRSIDRTNDLLAAQNKLLERMERYARPSVLRQTSPYLERTDGQSGLERSDSQSDAGSDGSLQGGTADSSGTGLGPGVSSR